MGILDKISKSGKKVAVAEEKAASKVAGKASGKVEQVAAKEATAAAKAAKKLKKLGKGLVGARGKKSSEAIKQLEELARAKISKGSGKPKNPIFEVSKKQYPNHTKMLENAQKNGHSLEGLERGSGTRAAQKNRYEAQKEIRKKQGPPPKGCDYDEFPYASTKQGGAGSHVEPVQSAENQAVGRDLGKFYREQAIKENGKFDIKITD